MKTKLVTICCCILIAFVVIGCGGGGKKDAAAPAQVSQSASGVPVLKEPVHLHIGSGSVGGATYTAAVAISQVVTEKVPNLRLTAELTASLGVNFAGTNNGDYEVGLTDIEFVYFGARGGNVSENPNYVNAPNIRALYAIEPTLSIAVVMESNSKIKSFEDVLKPGIKIGGNLPGGGAYAMWGQLFELIDQDWDKMVSFTGGHTQLAEALKDGIVDVVFNKCTGLSFPNGAFAELNTTSKVTYLAMPASVQDKYIKKYPMYIKVDIPVGWGDTNTIKVPTPTVGANQTCIVNKDVPDDVVYLMVKAIMENLDELGLMNTSFKVLSKETAAKDLPCALHPGAERYYKEKGYNITYLQ